MITKAIKAYKRPSNKSFLKCPSPELVITHNKEHIKGKNNVNICKNNAEVFSVISLFFTF